jgi:hypothetical protein
VTCTELEQPHENIHTNGAHKNNNNTTPHNLAPSDLHLFVPLKEYLGQKFQTGELKHGILNGLCGQDKTFYAAGTSNLMGQWKKMY